jgi:uncharacterized protein
MVITDLSAIALSSATKEEENLRFQELLRTKDSDTIDNLVFALNESVSPQIDCTACGNCCKSLMINVNSNDAGRLANHLHIPKKTFEEKYVEKSKEGTLAVMNAIPCHFLHNSKCTVYEARPDECREFPGLNQPGFTKRLFPIFFHYSHCPIIYNVIEAMKEKLILRPLTEE